MRRTRNSPIPAGRIAPGEALGFGVFLAVASVLVMALATNVFAALVLAASIGFYVFIYTMWLKRRTAQNIVIGGAAGAFPPVIGWAAVTGGLDVLPLLMFAIVFFWTPPHFWALSLWRSDDYARAGVPMLPVVKGKPHTRLQILLYTIALVPLGIAPAVLGFAGALYLAAAAGTGAWFLWAAIGVYRETDAANEPAARRLFGVSLVYLTALFAALIAEKLIGLPALTLPMAL
jgi:protoheme IX farnesyltransferase